MKTQQALNVTKAIFSMLIMAAVITGCQKENVTPGIADQVQPLINKKDINYFLKYSGGTSTTGTFAVYKWFPDCVAKYGKISPAPYQHSSSEWLPGTPNYIRVWPGECTLSPINMYFETGVMFGEMGPWYFIYPRLGPSQSVRKGIKIRFKNSHTPSDLSTLYNNAINYDEVLNKWDLNSAIATGYFDIEEIVPGFFITCPLDERK